MAVVSIMNRHSSTKLLEETWSPTKGLTWLSLNDLSGRDDSETCFLSELSVEQMAV